MYHLSSGVGGANEAANASVSAEAKASPHQRSEPHTRATSVARAPAVEPPHCHTSGVTDEHHSRDTSGYCCKISHI